MPDMLKRRTFRVSKSEFVGFPFYELPSAPNNAFNVKVKRQKN